ncbi:MAG: Rho termination factor N-terminal domain-containing protein [Oscillospiraceae bacterium]
MAKTIGLIFEEVLDVSGTNAQAQTKPIDKMSLSELKSMAETLDIDTIGAKTKEDFISKIADAQKATNEDANNE